MTDDQKTKPAKAKGPESTEDSKELIMRAAIHLFAQKGYAGTGVREIASQAGVNLAMINYFYGSKLGLLKEILERFFNEYLEIGQQALAESPLSELGPERFVTTLIHKAAAYFRREPELMRVALMELPFDAPDTAQFKAERITGLVSVFRAQWSQYLGGSERLSEVLAVIGPALLSTLASHYLLKHIIERVGLIELNEDFYRRYPYILTEFCLHGVNGVMRMAQQGRLPGDEPEPEQERPL